MTESSPTHQLIAQIAPLVAPLGYELVHVEVVTGRDKVLRLFIDRAIEDAPPSDGKTGIGIEDCVRVTKALDEPLDALPEISRIFKGAYELEVSSPGVDRPLRTEKDFARFAGREVRIHVYRPLTAAELGNATYQARNPKQKNFLGTLKGLRQDAVQLSVPLSGSFAEEPKKGKKSPKAEPTNSVEEVSIPLPLISKANLEPRFGIENGEST